MKTNHDKKRDRPLLTIAIPTCNRARFLSELLDSLVPQIKEEMRVELLISDNASTDDTGSIVKERVGRCIVLQYIRNAENVGPDANFLQCYERAAGKYVWIIGDDDLLRPGAVLQILNCISRDEYDLVYVSSKGFRDYPSSLRPVNPDAKARVYTDPAHFVRRVHISTTMISGNIINKDSVGAVDHQPFSRLINSNLIQLGWTFTALRGHRKSLYIEEPLVLYRLGNTGGYGVCRVFGVTLSRIAQEWLGDPRLSQLILNASLQRLLPVCLLAAKRRAHGSYLEEDPHALLAGVFGHNFRYWLFDYPLIVLPSGLGWIWLQILRAFDRIDRACGYPSLSW